MEPLNSFVESSVEKGEMPDIPFSTFILNLYWDYMSLILLYWLKDESESFTNTSRLIDMSLDIVVEVFKSGIIPKAMDIINFLFRTHIYNSLSSIQKFMDDGKVFTETLHKAFKDKK